MWIDNQIFTTIDCDKPTTIRCQLVIFDSAKEKVKTIKLASIDVQEPQCLTISNMSHITLKK